MPTVTSRKAAPSLAVLKQRRALAKERLDLDIELAGAYADIARLDANLKRVATELGESFKEDFGERGYVSASGAVASKFKGDVPQVIAEAWQKLPPAKRQALVKSGLIKIEPQWSRASNGRVTVKVL